MTRTRLPGSFRDPSGFVFAEKGAVYRQVNGRYRENFDHLMASGLYESLTSQSLLVAHEEVAPEAAPEAGAYKIIRPEQIPFISYPYEWCFGQLKAAALATLKIQKEALKHGMSLKDGSAYNIQFINNRPVLIDTLSFEKQENKKPWTGYRQFCQHFLAPLLLMSRVDPRSGRLLKAFSDGIPLDLASAMLSGKNRFNPLTLIHIHWHAASQKRYEDRQLKEQMCRVSASSVLGISDHLERGIEKLQCKAGKGPWEDYYGTSGYSSESLNDKTVQVAGLLDRLKPASVWDLGCNTGHFSRVASEKNIRTVAIDGDFYSVESLYRNCAEERRENILPLWMDLTNPSPGIGWQCKERSSLTERGPAGMVMALALIHHLAIANNIPLAASAEFFADLSRYLVVEFVPKEDAQVRRLLRSREDIFENYSKENFEKEFAIFFSILSCAPIKNSGRFLYLMEKRV